MTNTNSDFQHMCKVQVYIQFDEKKYCLQLFAREIFSMCEWKRRIVENI